ncbi:alpha/beta fold hydrolase [Halobaculum gomorrense]|uniref:Pimeloyl-ACP methyl ester carboxylesterase n=1 Tax=Halobaculum gomorrense TaxID=43928 RepID=A0A1M5MIN7_9EURY|nr:alpha/beta hydrolase [Halobaculum gomorrense]SHG77061.1 Pimeloyl-ACP methyl ester carboxylesterase [Halobaculum gomorrense]
MSVKPGLSANPSDILFRASLETEQLLFSSGAYRSGTPTAETNGVETYYERRGDGPPVVFVHGAAVDHTQWAPQFDALGLHRPVVCGLSMGGCIAMTYAARYPDGLSGLVLADTFGPVPLTLGERLQRAALRLTVPPARLLGYQRVERAMVWLQERVSGEGVGGDYDRIEAIRESGPLLATEELAKVIRALSTFHRTELDYAGIAVPTLLLYGEHEATFVRRQMHSLAVVLPHATLLVVPDAGHASNLDNEAFVDGAIRGHLRRLWPEHDPSHEGAAPPPSRPDAGD